MKRILFLTFYYPPDLCAGSFRSEALIQAVIPLLKNIQESVEIDIVTTQPNRYADFEVFAPTKEKIHSAITIHRIAIASHQSGFFDQALAFTHYFFKSFKWVKNKKYDFVYGTSSRLFTAFLSARIASQKSIPLFLDIRDIFTDTMQSLLKFPLILVLPVLHLVERYTIKQAKVLNLVSKGFVPYFKNKINSHCEMTYFSHGVDPCFNKVDFSLENKNALKKIVYAGNIGQGQGIEKIIPQMAKHFQYQCEFYIIGGGGKIEELKNNCSDLKNVFFIPPVKRENLIQYYQSADILFLHLNNVPAFQKVLPSKIFEYAQTGKPILAGLSGYSETFMRQHIPDAVIFSPGNISEAISKLTIMIKETACLKNREVFYQEFNREKMMQTMALKLLSQLNGNYIL